MLGADPLNYLVSATREHGDVVYLDMGPRRFYLINHPDGVKHVLQDNNRNYRKGYEKLKPFLGNGLVASEGDFWRRQRRLMQPAFHRERIAALTTTMTEVTATMIERWRPFAERGEPIDAADEMMRLTLNIIVSTMFSTDVEREYAMLSEAFGVALEYLNTKLFSPIDIPERWPTPLNRRFLKARRTIDDVVYRVIGERRRTGNTGDDLLGMLLEARDEETGEGMSDEQLRDEVTTIFVAGHETTAATLTWTWYLLSKHPDIARRVSNEVDAALGGRTPAMADLSNLAYTRMVIDEAMRLYPPAWMFARLAIGDDEVCGYRIPAGSMVMLSPYVMHRHPAYWDNPEGFDPERFLPERSADRPKYAYFPFGGGPRLCIGNTFSQIEAQLIVAMVAQTYRLHLLPGYRVEARPISTLRPHPGVMMTVQKR